MSGRLVAFISSRAFMLLLALAGLLLLTWPLAGIAAGEGAGQFIYIFAVWGLLIAGAAVWGLNQPECDGRPVTGQDGEIKGECCAWPPEEEDAP